MYLGAACAEFTFFHHHESAQLVIVQPEIDGNLWNDFPLIPFGTHMCQYKILQKNIPENHEFLRGKPWPFLTIVRSPLPYTYHLGWLEYHPLEAYDIGFAAFTIVIP